MNCTRVDQLLCDYLDGTLTAADRAEVDSHLRSCPACEETLRDTRGALSFIERVGDVEPPPALAANILNNTLSGKHGQMGSRARSWFSRLLAPVLQPRLVMGMALTVISFSMMARCAGVPVRQLQAADLEPIRIWANVDNTAYRLWSRGVKFYDSLKFVYEVQSRLHDWTEQQEEEERNAAARRPLEQRRLPASPDPAPPSEQTAPK
ncbi:MAG: anti-sigma factor family protein [Bryobacteraceae bacterium]